MKTRTLLFALGLAMSAGCAHGSTVAGRARDGRGSMVVAGGARLLLFGPAACVHASIEGTKTVALFVVERKHGDDGDCVAALAARVTTPVLTDTTGVRMEIAAGQELCAASPQGPTEVSWHSQVTGGGSLWALR